MRGSRSTTKTRVKVLLVHFGLNVSLLMAAISTWEVAAELWLAVRRQTYLVEASAPLAFYFAAVLVQFFTLRLNGSQPPRELQGFPHTRVSEGGAGSREWMASSTSDPVPQEDVARKETALLKTARPLIPRFSVFSPLQLVL